MVNPSSRRAISRDLVIGFASFLTLIDLFGSQALLPSLTNAYDVDPGTMGVAVNASTIGMAAAGIAVALFGRNMDRKQGIWLSLALLAIPTSLLATTDNVTTFAMLRILQGIFMSTAFTLTMTYLAEECSPEEAARAMGAYITGNVASNLFGRLLAAGFADQLGLSNSFYAFAVLNISGAVLVYFCLGQATPRPAGPDARAPLEAWREHLSSPPLRASFGIGFLILFAFIGIFTYVNFILVRAPFSLSPTELGLVYLVFIPSMFTTPTAGKMVARFGVRRTFWVSMAVAGIGLVLLMTPSLPILLVGLALVASGTFCAQAITTGFVGKAATQDRATASGIYLACYYIGGLIGAIALGKVFDALGWYATASLVGLTIAASCLLAAKLVVQQTAE